MLLELAGSHGLGKAALVTVCSWNRNAIMDSAWCTGYRMRLEHERYYGLGRDALVPVCS